MSLRITAKEQCCRNVHFVCISGFPELKKKNQVSLVEYEAL